MRVALLADIHSNREALEACLAHAAHNDVQRLVFLGDLVGYGADPRFVVETVMRSVESGAAAVLGNHDAAVVEGPMERMRPSARRAVEWTRGQLGRDHLEFLAAMPLTCRDGTVLYVHANAWAPHQWEYVVAAAEARESLLATDARYTFCGHVHEPALYHINRRGHVSGFVPSSGMAVPLGAQRRWLAIAGSVGQPRDGVLAARYAIFDSDASVLTWYEVAYDYEAALRKTIAAGLPPNIVVPQRQQ
jgi:predicted phosphodiesterase